MVKDIGSYSFGFSESRPVFMVSGLHLYRLKSRYGKPTEIRKKRHYRSV